MIYCSGPMFLPVPFGTSLAPSRVEKWYWMKLQQGQQTGSRHQCHFYRIFLQRFANDLLDKDILKTREFDSNYLEHDLN